MEPEEIASISARAIEVFAEAEDTLSAIEHGIR
jgi:hypothetical protein